jgi:hypothetical protein
MTTVVFLFHFLGFTDYIRTVIFRLRNDPTFRFLQRVTLNSLQRQNIISLRVDDLLSDRSLATCSINRYQ